MKGKRSTKFLNTSASVSKETKTTSTPCSFHFEYKPEICNNSSGHAEHQLEPKINADIAAFFRIILQLI